MEVPAETSLEALRLAKAHGVFSILNPAPAPQGGLDEVRAGCVGPILLVWKFIRRVREAEEGRRGSTSPISSLPTHVPPSSPLL